ncbi:MAG: hypothetical protein MUC49_02150 [Raineya sp.]|jgi:hypothetical protein|nr:hypothetical protein [Raineya sp.]
MNTKLSPERQKRYKEVFKTIKKVFNKAIEKLNRNNPLQFYLTNEEIRNYLAEEFEGDAKKAESCLQFAKKEKIVNCDRLYSHYYSYTFNDTKDDK